MQDEHGQVEESYSVSAGLDFPSVGPQHAYLNAIGRAEYESITDDEALDAFQALARNEGIIPALESSHALAHAIKMAYAEPDKEQLLVVNLRAEVIRISSPYTNYLKTKERCNEPLSSPISTPKRRAARRFRPFRDDW